MAVTDLNQARGSLPRRQRPAILQKLQDEGRVDASAVSRAELIAGRTGQPVEQVLNQLGALSDDALVAAYAEACRCETWDPRRTPPDPDPEALGVTIEFLRRARLLPLQSPGAALICAACDPLDDEALSGLVFATGRPVKVMAARPGDWRRAFDEAFAEPETDTAPEDERRIERELDQVAESGAEGAGARLVATAFEAAIAAGASDIHFEPRRNDFRIRLRVDGRLVDHQVAAADLAAPAVSRVKVIANLDLGERRLPQDGRTTFVIAGRQIDVRVATSPTVFGESAVLRILDRLSVPLDIDTLGFGDDVASVLRQAAKSPHGLFLATCSKWYSTGSSTLRTFLDEPAKVCSSE